MRFTIDMGGIADLKREVERLANDAERLEVDKRIVERCATYSKPVMEKEIPRSEDHSKSGRGYKGGGKSRPSHGHAADNVPVSKTKEVAGKPYVEVGWNVSDTSEYFYVKFINWGVSDKPPISPFVEETIKKSDPEWSRIAEQEYQDFISRLEG